VKINAQDLFQSETRVLPILPYYKITIKSLDWDGLGTNTGKFIYPGKLLNQMVKTCHQADGIGLAAPQVGVFRKIFIIRAFVPTEDPNLYTTFFNPTFRAVENAGKSEDEEGCLSVPGGLYKVTRWNVIKAHWYDYDEASKIPQEHTALLDGLTARVYQHELCHLKGTNIVEIGKPSTTS